MIKRESRLVRWYWKLRNCFRTRKISDYRTTFRVEKLYYTGALQATKFTGDPLAREYK